MAYTPFFESWITAIMLSVLSLCDFYTSHLPVKATAAIAPLWLTARCHDKQNIVLCDGVAGQFPYQRAVVPTP